MDYSFLNGHKIIPVVVLESADEVVTKLAALREGGIKIAEITFRTACAEDALAVAVRTFDDMLVGAGTVINGAQCARAIALGARFIVSPGFSEDVCVICKQEGVPYIPGVVTPTEIMTAKAAGLNVLKFFPAGAYGGVKTMKALSAAFPDVKFVPTGGVDLQNLKEYAAAPFVAAIGGSFMMKGNAGDIKNASAQAVKMLEE